MYMWDHSLTPVFQRWLGFISVHKEVSTGICSISLTLLMLILLPDRTLFHEEIKNVNI